MRKRAALVMVQTAVSCARSGTCKSQDSYRGLLEGMEAAPGWERPRWLTGWSRAQGISCLITEASCKPMIVLWMGYHVGSTIMESSPEMHERLQYIRHAAIKIPECI